MRLPALLAVSLLCLTPRTVAAPAPEDPAALATAVTAAPSLTAARARAEAARARLDSSGRLPNPELEGMVSRQQMPDDSMPMWEISVRQPLPKAGERVADRERATAVVAMAEADFTLMAGEMAADTAMALAEAETAQRRIELLSAQLTRTEQVLAALDSRIATGTARSTDRLALQTRIASMQLMVAQDRRMAEDALADARGRLGLAPDAALPTFSTPPASAISAETAPAVLVAHAKNTEAQAMGRMARASAKPMTAVGLRFEREQAAMGNNDTIGVAFMTELPFRSRRYARADERAARADADAALADADVARHRLTTTLARAERAERLATLARRLADETQTRLAADYDTLRRNAGLTTTSGNAMSSDTSVLMILEVLEKTTDAQLQAIDADGAARLARAELWRYAPASFFPTP